MSTQLDVLNACLRAVGERPVTDYNSLHPTALSARQTVEDVDKEFQSMGWWFNKEYNLTLSHDVGTGEIIIPEETLEIKPQYPFSHLVRRENKLYDPVNHTFNIGESVTVTLTIQISINDLPVAAANYLKAMARYRWAVEEEIPEERINRYDREVLVKKTFLMNEQFKQLDINSGYRPVSAFLKQHLQTQGALQYDATYPGGDPLG